MDTSDIHADKVTTKGGLHFGEATAPVKIVEFINLRCPYSKMWWEKAAKVVDPYVKEGKVERIVKHFDKEKASLRNGNVMHHHLSYEDVKETRKSMDYIIDHLDEWADLKETDVAAWVEDYLELDKKENAKEASKIIEETKQANIFSVPSVFIEDYIFDENISDEELKEIIETKL